MQKFCDSQLDDACVFLQRGGVLAYPSESVWGLGCDAYHTEAVEKILTLKRRADDKGLIVLTDIFDRILPIIHALPDIRRQQILARMQSADITADQATTWLVPLMPSLSIPKVLYGDFSSLAVRVTPHPMLQALCGRLVGASNPYGFLVSTSCNLSGQVPANSFAQAYDYFGDTVGYLAGEGLGYRKPSRIIDALTGNILR